MKKLKGFSPCQQRTLAALFKNPHGIRSYELGRIARTMYPTRAIQKLRARGFKVKTYLEPYVTWDGDKVRVARYILDPNDRSTVVNLLHQLQPGHRSSFGPTDPDNFKSSKE